MKGFGMSLAVPVVVGLLFAAYENLLGDADAFLFILPTFLAGASAVDGLLLLAGDLWGEL